MKIVRYYLSTLLLLGSMLAHANLDVNGTWQGELAVTPDSHVIVQFKVNPNADDGYHAVLNVPNESSLRNIPATIVNLEGDTLTLVIDEVGGKYVGKISSDSITGVWTQQGSTFPLDLKPYIKQPLSRQVIDKVAGEWHGILNIPRTARQLALVFRIEADEDNMLHATLDSPDQSLSDIVFDEVTFSDEFITLKVLDPEMSYHGTLSEDGLVGEWTQGGSAPLNMVKGKYQGKGLDVDERTREKLRGQWYGQVGSAITLVFRFEDRPDESFGAYLDSPDQGRKDVPMSAIKLKGDKLQITIDGYDSVFTGTVTQTKIVGDLAQGEQLNQLTMQRGTYEPPLINLPQQVEHQLLGKWKGIAGSTELLFSFVKDQNGEFRAYLGIPAQRLSHLPLGGFDVGETAGNLNFVVKGIGAEFEGKADSNLISGMWTMPGFQFPLRLERTVR